MWNKDWMEIIVRGLIKAGSLFVENYCNSTKNGLKERRMGSVNKLNHFSKSFTSITNLIVSF